MSAARWIGVKAKAMRERLGSEKDLPDGETVQVRYGCEMAGKVGGFANDLKARNAECFIERNAQKRALTDRQRTEPAEAVKRIEERAVVKARTR